MNSYETQQQLKIFTAAALLAAIFFGLIEFLADFLPNYIYKDEKSIQLIESVMIDLLSKKGLSYALEDFDCNKNKINKVGDIYFICTSQYSSNITRNNSAEGLHDKITIQFYQDKNATDEIATSTFSIEVFGTFYNTEFN